MRMNIIKWDESIYYRYIHRFPCIAHKKSSSSQSRKDKEAPDASCSGIAADIETGKSISGSQTEDTDIHMEEKCCLKNMPSSNGTASKTGSDICEAGEPDNIPGIGVGQVIECDIIYGCISDL